MARVGLLEDNTRIAKLCAMMLYYAGHEVSIYEHPRDCLCALQLLSDTLPTTGSLSSPTLPTTGSLSFSKPLPIDVLILDLHLPDITGMEILRLLCSQPCTKSIPLILCTAATANEISNAKRLAPNANLIEKPFSYRSLISAIASALEAQRA